MKIEDIERKLKEEENRHKKAIENNERLGKGLKVGKVFRVLVADSYAIYEIKRVGKLVSKVIRRTDIGDEYYAECVDSDGNILTSILKKIVDREERLMEIFKGGKKDGI